MISKTLRAAFIIFIIFLVSDLPFSYATENIYRDSGKSGFMPDSNSSITDNAGNVKKSENINSKTAGTFVINVSGDGKVTVLDSASGNKGEGIAAQAISPADANDQCGNAQFFDYQTQYADGSINPSGDMDWWRISVGAYGQIRVALDGPSGKNFDLYFVGDCNSAWACRPYESDADETCLVDVQPGDYNILVDGYESSTGSYRIDTSLTPCDLTSASWDRTSAYEGEGVGLTVSGQYCDGFVEGAPVSFEMFEADPLRSWDTWQIDPDPASARFSSGQASSVWQSIWIDDGFGQGDPEYVFRANAPTESIWTGNQLSIAKNADLIVEDIWTEPGILDEDAAFTFKFKIKNSGGRGISSSNVFYSDIYINGDFWTYCAHDDGLGAGAAEECYASNQRWPAGTYTIRVDVDPENYVGERDDSNNARQEDIVIAPGARPDIIVEDIWTEPGTVYQDSSFDIKLRVKNNGNRDVSSSNVFYSYIYVNGTHGATCEHNQGIPVGGTEVCTVRNVTGDAGTYTIKVRADATNNVIESNENNNEREENINIINRCDLTSASWDSADAHEGDAVGLTVTGQYCDGQAVSFEVFESDIYGARLWDVDPDPASAAFLSGQAWSRWTAQWMDDGALQGDPEYTFRANGATASIMSDNELRVARRIPDLMVEDIWTEPGNPDGDTTFTFKFSVKNVGTRDVGSMFYSDIYVDGDYATYCEYSGLSAGASVVCVAPNQRWSPGTYAIRIVADSRNSVEESDENNNERQEDITVRQGRPELVVAGIWTEPESPDENTAFALKFLVGNNGTGDIGSSAVFRSYVYRNGVYWGYCPHEQGLLMGQDEICVAPNQRWQAGTYSIRVETDAENSVAESNENNNQLSREVVVTEKNNDNCLSADADNLGTRYQGRISAQGDVDWHKWSVPSLPGRFTVTLDVPSGLDYDLKLYRDCGSAEICESDYGEGMDEECGVDASGGSIYAKVYGYRENQHSSSQYYYITGSFLPSDSYDLVPGSFVISPDYPDDDDTISITYGVINRGSSTLSADFVYKLFIDNMLSQTCAQTADLPVNEEWSCAIEGVTLSAGTHTLKIIADANNDVSEIDESNNVKTQSLMVQSRACPIPDGASEGCDCDYNYECPSTHPYCEDEYPSPVSDGWDACLSSMPLYCGDSICNNGETWQACQNDCIAPNGRVYVDVDNPGESAISRAQVYLDNAFKGTTNSIGKIDFLAGYGSRNVKVNCPNGDYCGTKSVYVDGIDYVDFDCDCQGSQFGDLEIYVYNRNMYPIVNVIGYINSNEVGISNPFGLIRASDVPYGTANLKLELYIAKYDPIKAGYYYRTLAIDSPKKTVEVVIDESELELRNTYYTLNASDHRVYAANASGNVSLQTPLLFLAAIPIVMEVIDIASVSYSANEFCKCAYNNNQLIGGVQECAETLYECNRLGMNGNACIERVKAFSAVQGECFDEAAFLVGDVASPLIPVGLIGGVIVKAGSKFTWLDNAGRVIGKTADGTWQYIKKVGDNVLVLWVKVTGTELQKRGVELGVRAIYQWSDEELEALTKIASKGGEKSGKGLISAFGEGEARKLVGNLAELGKRNVKGMDDMESLVATFSKRYEELSRTGSSEAAKGALNGLKGIKFELEIATHPSYIDNVIELRKKIKINSQGIDESDIDIFLKNGDIIEAKAITWDSYSGVSSIKGDLAEKIRYLRYENPNSKITIKFQDSSHSKFHEIKSWAELLFSNVVVEGL